LKKLEKMRSRTEIEMAFMEILKIIQHQVFLRNCRGKVLEKFKIFSDSRLDYAGFDSEGPGGQLQSSAACRQHVGVAGPKPGAGWFRVVLVTWQLSGGQIDARDASGTPLYC
jgi:hypothetical protein